MSNATLTKTSEFRFVISDHLPEFGAAWYVVNTNSGHEYKVIEALKTRIKTLGVEDKIYEVIVPIQKKMVIKRGQKMETNEKVLPGYILVHMLLEDDSWNCVRSTPGVTRFIGIENQPTRIAKSEVESIIKNTQEEKPKYQSSFAIGDVVKITNGPFLDFIGTIDNIDEQKGKLRVLVSFFERETPVELDFLQVSKDL